MMLLRSRASGGGCGAVFWRCVFGLGRGGGCGAAVSYSRRQSTAVGRSSGGVAAPKASAACKAPPRALCLAAVLVQVWAVGLWQRVARAAYPSPAAAASRASGVSLSRVQVFQAAARCQ
jgi:hypothetical protein